MLLGPALIMDLSHCISFSAAASFASAAIARAAEFTNESFLAIQQSTAVVMAVAVEEVKAEVAVAVTLTVVILLNRRVSERNLDLTSLVAPQPSQLMR